jgi:MoaA/NifB/PqqE/SkfB family radical SAM enzyme
MFHLDQSCFSHKTTLRSSAVLAGVSTATPPANGQGQTEMFGQLARSEGLPNMPDLVRIAKQGVRGIPYLEKELRRRLSVSTGYVFATPITYYMIFSGFCNLACTFCEIYKHVDPILSGETMLRLIREAKELSGGGFNISLCGGEPMIYEPLYECLELAQKLKINFGFTTNGLSLSPRNVERLLSYDPFNINVSLESVNPEINEALRRPMRGGTQRTLEGIENLLAEKERTGARVSVIVKSTIMEQNYRTLPDLVRHFGKDSKLQFNFQPFVGVKEDPHWVRDSEGLKGMLQEIRDLQREGYPVMGDEATFQGFCDYVANPPVKGNYRHMDLEGQKRNCDIGLRAMTIWPTGDVYFCDFLGRPIGNIHKQSLSEIYYGATASGQRQEMVWCDIDCQQTCKRGTSLAVKARAFLRMG